MATNLARNARRPYNGDLLLEASDDQTNNYTQSLWQSTDGGQHRQHIGPVVAMSGNPVNTFVVQQPVTGQPWHICTATYDSTGQGGQGQNTLTCTSDNGDTWITRTAFSPLLVAISDDGAVLGVAAQDTAPGGSITGYALYRLPAGASQWQSLGPVPGFTVLYAPTPGAGVLWAVPAVGIMLDQHNRVFTVPYA